MSKKVALMCGHGKSTDGSWDCGTSYGGNNEAALMLPITKAAVKYLRSWGVSVISDADNNNNKNMIADCAWSDKWGADVYVSVHCDYYKAPSGVMPLYVSTKGKQLATCLNNAVKSGMGMKSRGVVKRTDLYELNYPDAISCILETGSIKADISILKNKTDAYGKCIAKGICDYLGVKITATTASTTAPATTTTTLYRVRKSWTDAKSQIGAYKDLNNAKKVADEKGLNVYGANGKLVYEGKKKEVVRPIQDKIIEACKVQAEWMKNFTYKWESKPTIEKSKKKGTCVTYTACVLQRVGLLKSGEHIWHNGKGYGTGKVTGNTSKFNVMYQNNKTLSALKGTLQKGDVILCDDNKSGESGSGGHVFIFSGQWASNGNPLIYDQNSATYAKQKKSLLRSYPKSHKVLAICRAK